MKRKLKRVLEYFVVPLEEFAPLSQQGRGFTVQRVCEEFTIESAFCVRVQLDRSPAY